MNGFQGLSPLVEVQEAKPPKGPWGGFQGGALTLSPVRARTTLRKA